MHGIRLRGSCQLLPTERLRLAVHFLRAHAACRAKVGSSWATNHGNIWQQGVPVARTRHSNVYLQARQRLAQKNVPQHLATRGERSLAWKAIQARKCNRDPHIGEMQMPPGNTSQGYATTSGCAQQFVLSVLRSVLMMFIHSCARVTHVISTMCTRPWPGKGAEGSWKWMASWKGRGRCPAKVFY